MNQFHKLFRWAWSVIVVFSLAFAMVGCEGDDGAQGPAGATGSQGPAGPPGQDLTPDVVAAAVAEANVESCSTCHDGAGGLHQAYYNEYVDSTLAMTIDDVTSVANLVDGGFDITVEYSLMKDGVAYINAPADFDTHSFYIVQLDAQGEFVTADTAGFYTFLDTSTAASNGDGSYTLTNNVAYDVSAFAGGAVVGKVGLGVLDFPDNPYDTSIGRRVRGYRDLATAAFEVGGGDLATWQSVASVEACQGCHGTPYRKHGNLEAVVADVPTFTQCKACHVSDRNGGHEEWQYMVDEPFNWATGVAPTEDYTYTRNLMNDVHMSHAMEFPYPMSMSNCATCHRGANLTAVLDNSNFRPDVCRSCHVIQGIDAWPDDAGTTLEGMYAQEHRPPPLEFLWERAGVTQVHNFVDISVADCATNCHGANFPGLSELHSGYDHHIYDDNGNRYAATNTVSVDAVTVAGDLITVEFSASNADINPTLAISFYGWDTKHYLVAAHDRDANGIDCPHSSRPGCNIEWSPGSTKPFFTEEAGSVAGAWIVTFDMSGYQAYKTDPIPQLIADGKVKFIEIAVLPRLSIGGRTVNIEAVTTTYDLAGAAFVDDYFQGLKATVNFDKCKACHDNVTTLVHTGSGRFGDSMQTCKACHATTFAGSHLEMQSRSIDSYVHAIHAFQPFDEDDVYNGNDPVFEKRNEMHKHHAFPYFTSLACEGCHNPGTYNVPDQSMSMPGVQSASWSLNDPNDRLIGTIPELVQGAASRSCGSCHRAQFIKHDEAGSLVSFNAHTGTFGSAVANDPLDDDDDGLEEEPVLFGIIDKIMSLFE